MVTSTSCKNLKKVFAEFDKYNERVRESSNPLYKSIVEREAE